MERRLIENPGYLCICDAGLIQVLPHDRVPGQSVFKPEDWTAKTVWMLRLGRHMNIKMLGVRHQDNIGSKIYGLPPLTTAAETAFLNVQKPKMKFVQQMMFFAADAKGKWPSWNHLEDRARAQSEQELSGEGSIAVFEGCSIRFNETKTTRERHCDKLEWQQNRKTLSQLYGVKLAVRHPRHETPGRVCY